MAKSSYQGANVEITTDTFGGLINKLNQVVYDMGTVTVTAAAVAQPNTTNGGQTTGNVHVEGVLSSNTLAVFDGIRGGSASVPGNLNVLSNTIFQGFEQFSVSSVNTFSIATSTFSLTANVTSDITPNGLVSLGTPTALWSFVYANNVVADGTVDLKSDLILRGSTDRKVVAQSTNTGYRSITFTLKTSTNNVKDILTVDQNSVKPFTDITYDLGEAALRWRNLYAQTATTSNTVVNDTLTANTMSVSGPATFGGVLTANSANAVHDISGSMTIGGNLTVTGTTTFSSNASFAYDTSTANTITVLGLLDSQGNTVLGNANTDRVTFNARVSSAITPSANIVYNLGSTGQRWNTVFAQALEGKLAWANLLNVPSPNISLNLSGVVQGSANVTLTELASGSLNLAVTANNSIVLGTHTSGNYTRSISAGSGISVTGGNTAGGNAVIASTDSFDSVLARGASTSRTVTFNGPINANTMTTTGSVVIGGDLTVSGNTTIVNTETVTIADNIILLNSNETGSPTQNAGFEVERGNLSNVSFVWNESLNRFSTEGNALQATTFYGELSGNASTATSATTASRLGTARTISLSGDATGSVAFDGSSNVTLTVAVDDDSHTHDLRYYTKAQVDGTFYDRTTSDSRFVRADVDSSAQNLTAISLKISSADGYQWKSGNHRITHNDGAGNVQIRLGHYVASTITGTGGNTVTTYTETFTQPGNAWYIGGNIDSTTLTPLTIKVASNPTANSGTAVAWGSQFNIYPDKLQFGGIDVLTKDKAISKVEDDSYAGCIKSTTTYALASPVTGGTYTPEPVNSNYKKFINGGSFTLGAPTLTGNFRLSVLMTNNGTAGNVTFSGWNKVYGDTLSTVNGKEFIFDILVIDGRKTVQIIAL
jgi:hypothetical protein